MKHPLAQPQYSQAYQIAAQALKDYVDVLDRFVSNEDAGLKMLHVQKHRLERWYDKLIKQQQELQKTSVNFKGETYHPLIMQRLRANANRVIARVATARSVLEDSPEFVYEQLRHEIIAARRALGKGTSLKEAEHNIAQHSHNIKKLYEQSRPETKQLFGPMDQWLEWGMEYAIILPQADERLHAMLTMPQEITRAKWLFMTALANLSYDIGLEDHHDRRSDNKDLLLISRMMERLARHERGGNNPHMPPNCKLRHNPSIHSIHVVALAKKIFDEASAKIETSTNLHGDSKIEAIEYLRAMSRRLMFGAMVHDMGEMEGEISQGIEVAKQPDEIRKLFDIQRENIEQKVFDKHLDELATKPDSEGNAIYKHPQWEGSEGCKGRKNTFIDAFELAEHKETFAGRLLKSLERMQSQQDYLRFQSLLADSDYPRLHQPPIRKSHTSRYTPEQIQEEADKNKRFSLNYVSSIFRDASIHDAQGQNSLEHIGEREGNFVQRTVHAALVVAMKAEYNHLMNELQAAFEGPRTGFRARTRRGSAPSGRHAA